MAVQQTSLPEYLVESEAAWIKALREEVIDPTRAAMLRHPLSATISQGTLPLQKVRRYLSDTLWIIKDFPQLAALLLARAPRQDWELRQELLENCYSERGHPQALARAVKAVGGDADMILDGPDWAYKPLKATWDKKNWMELVVSQRSWIEAMAAIGVGVEAMVPSRIYALGIALRDAYGVKEEDLEWFGIHGGAVEQGHGNEGLRVLERYVRPDDAETQARCRDAIEKTIWCTYPYALDAYYNYKGE